jgi:hypothetical protein
MNHRKPFCFLLVLLAACSGHRNESELGMAPSAFTGQFRAIPGEKLTYRARMGPFQLGELKIRVAENPDTIRNRPAWCIRADGSSTKGISWISVVEHHWESWVDTANGFSLLTRREARENKYRVKDEVKYLPDSSLIISRNLLNNESRRLPSRPESMQDLLNLMWKLRFTDFERFKIGDTLNYSGFHDKEWLSFRLILAGKTRLGKGKKSRETWELYPIGLATSFLRGKNPARIWIETAPSRRPLEAKLETYFGNFRVNLVE